MESPQVIIPTQHQAAPSHIIRRSNEAQVHIASGKPTAAEYGLLNRTIATLLRHYPGYIWDVHITGGVMQILNKSLSGRWGVILKLNTVQDDPNLKAVMTAGGEILERYNLERRKMNPDKLIELPRDFSGNLTFHKD